MNRKQEIVVAALFGIAGLLCSTSCGDNDGERTSDAEQLQVRYFDIQDLGFPARIFHGNPPIDLGDEYLPERPAPPTVRGVHLEDALMAHIRRTSGGEEAWGNSAEDFWGHEDSTDLPFLGVRNLIVIARNAPDVLDKIEELLDEIRASGDPVTYLETHGP